QMGIRVLNYLMTDRSQGAATQPSRAPRVDYQSTQEPIVTQTEGGLSGNYSRLHPDVGADYAGAIPDDLAIGGFSQTRDQASLEGFSEDARPNGGRLFYDTFGPATHAASPILAQSSFPIPRLAPGMIFCQGGPPLYNGRVPLDDLTPVSNRNTVGSDLSKEGSYNGRLQPGLGRSAGGPSGIRSDSISVVAYINRQGSLRSSHFYRLARRLLLWGQKELLSLKAVQVPGRLNLGMDMLSRGNVAPANGCYIFRRFRKFGRFSGRQRSTSLPQKTTLTAQLFFQCSEMLWPMTGPVLAFTPFPPQL
ncbi:hypothetical protein M9458_021928, partial [Cirrhinus mrigala]